MTQTRLFQVARHAVRRFKICSTDQMTDSILLSPVRDLKENKIKMASLLSRGDEEEEEVSSSS